MPRKLKSNGDVDASWSRSTERHRVTELITTRERKRDTDSEAKIRGSEEQKIRKSDDQRIRGSEYRRSETKG